MGEAKRKVIDGKIVIYSDGAARGNPGPAGAGGQIKGPAGENLAEISEYIGETTNNVAEYKALILALEKAVQFKPLKVEIRSDSELMVKQISGEYKVKNEGLKPLHERVKQLLTRFKEVTVRHIYRTENVRADELANEAIDKYTKGEKTEKRLDDIHEQQSLF